MEGQGIILGVDGGGSKTLAMLADRSGSIVQTVRTGGVNPMDNPGWRDELLGCLAPFAATPGLAGIAVAVPVFGEVASLSAAQEQAVADTFGGVPQAVLNDVDAAHLGAFAGGPGILILSGTGSMAWARDAAGRSFRVGGWGDQIGDEGSSYWLGRRLLSLVTKSLDGRAPPTGLADALFDTLQLDRADPANALEGWVTHQPHVRAAIASLAVLASRLAEAGDAGAQGLIADTAAELAEHVMTIARLAELPPDWSFAGGTFVSAPLRAAMTRRLDRAPVPPRLPPIGGALLRAADIAGWPADDLWIAALATSIETYQQHSD